MCIAEWQIVNVCALEVHTVWNNSFEGKILNSELLDQEAMSS